MPPTILHDRDSRTITLYFNPTELQSQMRTDAPDELLLPYTRTMTSFLHLHPNPRHVAVIGLGGGSMTKFLYRTLPNTLITTIEIDPEVIALRDKFQIPPDDHRLHILCQDGASYIAEAAANSHTNPPDVLLIDAFGPHGQPPQLCTQNFYDACFRLLPPNGLLIANLCDPEDLTHLSRLQTTFSNNVFLTTFEDGQNKVAFARKGAPLPQNLPEHS